MDDVRVLLINAPLMLGDLIGAAIGTSRGVRLVVSNHWPMALVATVDRAQAEVVVFGRELPDLHEAAHELLWERPRLRVLIVSGDGRRTTLLELRAYREALGELSPDQLLRLFTSVRDRRRSGRNG